MHRIGLIRRRFLVTNPITTTRRTIIATQVKRSLIHRSSPRPVTVPNTLRLLPCHRKMTTVTPSHPTSTKNLDESPFLKWDLFPDFETLVSQVKPEQAVPFFKALLDDTRDQFLTMEKNFEPTWESTIGQLAPLETKLSRAYGLLSHLNGVKNSPELRSTLEQVQPEFVKLNLLLNQSEAKFKALEQLKASGNNWAELDPVQQRIVDKTLLAMQHAGIGLPAGKDKERFNEISERLSQLSLSFSNHILDATKAYKKVIDNAEDLVGCSPAFLESLQKNAKANDVESGYCITLDYPIYGPLMMHCANRSLREEVYKANITKASTGDLDNEPLIHEILGLRQEKARLLGYKTYADLSLAVKMAHDVPTAESLLDELFGASINFARKELDALTQFAVDHLKHPEGEPLQPWDTSFVSEQYRQSLYKYDEETISHYFAFPKVLQGLFDVAREVLGIDVREMASSELDKLGITKWHADVKVFEVSENGNVKAYFYGDFYSRPAEKRSGAWMDNVTSRTKDPATGHVTLPVAYLICNQPPPKDETSPSLMKFRDVETLFHEFGHCLQHMMTRVDYADASGINGVEWDFVEVASQFMENFCSEKEWLDRLSGHYQTGEAMPQDMADALVKNREFLSGMAMLRQLHFAKVDLALHSTFTPPKEAGEPTAFDVDAEVAKKTVLVPRLPQDRFLCSFAHIFGGGYAAGYYSYKYSETFSADAYGAFEEAQGDKLAIRKVGQRYRDTVLALGGGTDPRDVWEAFRGRREVDVHALLRHGGLE
ncbi:zincin [Hesseltinella vesiculosa]|uniref:oligopeptidase A n=1 Tax=Hesseltinella vesiculosa TaxID=101127 RepID=A0A1X2GUU3_9FUNG|nr:zincin [Hesseltinella vesiculosa]